MMCFDLHKLCVLFTAPAARVQGAVVRNLMVTGLVARLFWSMIRRSGRCLPASLRVVAKDFPVRVQLQANQMKT